MEPVTIAALIAAALAGAAAFAMWQRASDAEAKVVELETEVERLRALSQARPTPAPEAPSERSSEPPSEEE